MCGIAGVVALSERGRESLRWIDAATDAVRARGPDHGATTIDGRVALGHRRLAVIDPTPDANQPMTGADGRFTLVYNGEAYNFAALRDELARAGAAFRTRSDTEVVLELLAREGAAGLARINGFFALALYDRERDSVLVARDRFGIKPLYLYADADRVVFGSTLGAILAVPATRSLDEASLLEYLQLTYVPAPYTMLRGVEKVEPGAVVTIAGKAVTRARYYDPPAAPAAPPPPYVRAAAELARRMEESVRRRLVSDVPLGAFLSGGLDSSIVVGLAARHTERLRTFAIGFPDHPRRDESADAERVARAFGTAHTTLPVTERELQDHVLDVLERQEEPFADSSALAVYLLSKRVREHVTVALSGDGGDELFAGYNKHAAEYAARHRPLASVLAGATGPLWRRLPRSREGGLANRVRQLDRFAAGVRRDAPERYWRWCSFTEEERATSLLAPDAAAAAAATFPERKARACRRVTGAGGLNDVLAQDLELVLPNDMLHKVDSMSMAHGLEVRVPFLDHEVVEFATSLPASYKRDARGGKRLVRDAFADLVPSWVLAKPKHGFEVPLVDWFRGSLQPLIVGDLLAPERIAAQGVFDPAAVAGVVRRLESQRPGDVGALVWTLVVFQHWWKRTME